MADHDDFAPGTCGCHEALHMAFVLVDMVDRHLCEHPAIRQNPGWLAKATAARDALFALHREIGAVHLGAPEGDRFECRTEGTEGWLAYEFLDRG